MIGRTLSHYRIEERLGAGGDIPLVRGLATPWMGLAPDGSPLVVSDRSTRDLYVLDWEAP